MATITEKDLGSQNVTASGNTDLYTVPGATRAIVRALRATNKHATDPITVKILHRPAAADLQFDVATLAAGEMADFLYVGVLTMETGDKLKINCSVAGNVDVVLTGAEVT